MKRPQNPAGLRKEYFTYQSEILTSFALFFVCGIMLTSMSALQAAPVREINKK